MEQVPEGDVVLGFLFLLEIGVRSGPGELIVACGNALSSALFCALSSSASRVVCCD